VLDPEHVFGQNVPMRRTGVRWRRLAVLVVSLVAGVSAMAGLAGAKPTASGPVEPGRTESRTYVVTSGDTLWGIAAWLVGPREDPRPMVERLSTLNGIRDGVIVPGERLALP
jgi:LysM domain